MLSNEDIKQILIKNEVLLDGHFLLTSGRHSRFYFEKFRVLQQPADAALFCRTIAEHFKGTDIDTVAGPTTGGIIIAFEVAKEMGKKAIYAERTSDGRGFLRGMSLAKGEKVLVVDDVMTTGGSVLETIEAVKKAGAELKGVAVFIDRSADKPDFGAPFFSLYHEKVETFDPENCPLCQQGIPLAKHGSSPKK
ncbi:MAG: orotate phosphoribosyltransferase [Candidatus Edwardsbacteria bacterium]|nr:orotate phosphoribosyltransferase [Candidatus Edwardsbacteria bacterium]MBU1576938.1 orotate phosphoribosyltransferase [Candidatus Edwardsbacteria bacterium]MBU2463304.1 orotate phosphoribosyltransferase [Candidatus Edwardsbacteria bacterium]MBU2593747.1 orotate phosphoribosyltransferase [Candidatus Edwardsbacteria bacterium]